MRIQKYPPIRIINMITMSLTISLSFYIAKIHFFVFLQHYYIIYLCPQTILDNHGKDKIQSPS